MGSPNSKKYWLKRKYNITEQQYDEIFEEQCGCCAICGVHQSQLKRALGVDHNHETKEVRGLLCSRCNYLIGICEENINILVYASLYLEKWNKKDKE